ncbi:hypothetical protein V6N12_047047 [Hibiscus sabdariffa]|uniref:Uncharacterized protein n=1 Tax=Hibiscus sabdariffa TaxID=183260 RepID=A0ABR2AP23_9ROSI
MEGSVSPNSDPVRETVVTVHLLNPSDLLSLVNRFWMTHLVNLPIRVSCKSCSAHQFSQENKINFLFLQETKAENLEKNKIKAFWGVDPDNCVISPANGFNSMISSSLKKYKGTGVGCMLRKSKVAIKGWVESGKRNRKVTIPAIEIPALNSEFLRSIWVNFKPMFNASWVPCFTVGFFVWE